MKRLNLDSGHLAYVEEGAGGTPVVLLHAGYVDHRMWSREVARLGPRARVVAPDARNHGRSSTARAPFRACDDLAVLLRHLDAGPAVLVGVSMGAGTALDTALEHPDLVRAVVVSGAGTSEPTFEDPWMLGVFAELRSAVERQDPQAWAEAELRFAVGPQRAVGDLDPAVVALLRAMHEDFVSTHVRPDTHPPTVVADSWGRLGEVAVPVLGIVGALDSPDHLRMCERAVASVADGRGVVHIEGAAHFPNLERPDAWDEAVDDFLRSVGVGLRPD